ncbi:hypothetical protein PTI98_008315 [Pleurotus ostreatus]|nr:hypothetical protein PTI98_008315 [Pleurotus ostreatus]
MSLTAEQANKNPDLLSRNRDKPSICRTYLDGTMGAILFEGKAFITTPNGDNVYEPVLGLTTTVRLRQDGRFGAEDPFQLPQQYVREHSHLACIRRPPTRREDTNDVMFMNPVYEDHFRSSHQSRIGLLDQRLVSRIREPSVLLVKRYYAFIESRPDLSQNRRFHGHATQLKIWIGRLESTKASWPDILFSFTQAQRHFLELEAYLEYMQVRQPLMNSDEYGRILSPTANFVGAVTNKVVIVEEFAKAGIPVWLIRPIREFPRRHAHRHHAADPQRHNNLMLFGREFLAYTDFGRTSVVRDTIERPPPVPSFGHDYSAGPARAPRAHNEPQHAPDPAQPYGRVTLSAQSPSIHADHDGVMGTRPFHRRGDQEIHLPAIQRRSKRVHIPTPPTTFVPLNSDADLKPRQLKILHAYITHLDVLLLRMSPRLSPTLISRKRWDLLLGPERSQPHATPVAGPSSRDTHSSQPAPKKMKLDNNYLRRQCMQGLLAKWTAEYDKDHQNRNEDLNWRSEVIPSDRWPHDRITERIMYEVIETNFRAGSFHMTIFSINASPSQSFEGEGGGDHMNVTYLTAWSGLSNPNDLERRKYVLAISRVMVDWRDCPGGIVDALRQEESDVDYVELEKTCASYYCRSFFHHFARAPSVPHRTKIDPSIYIMP